MRPETVECGRQDKLAAAEARWAAGQRALAEALEDRRADQAALAACRAELAKARRGHCVPRA